MGSSTRPGRGTSRSGALFAAGPFTVAQLIGAARTTFADPVDLATCLPLLRLLVGELGLEFAPRIRLDLEARPGKVPGAYCLPVRVPDDIVVAVSAGGGVGDCRPLFHEVGHALHFAYTGSELPVDCRRMGDEGLVEGWGVVTENIFLHRGWLDRSFPGRTATALGHDTAQRLLIVTRAQCVRLLFAVDAARRPAAPAELRSRYEQLMAEHLGARPGPIEYLDVLCGDFVSATRLRSWEFGTSVAQLLAHEIGPDWPGDPRAGRWLREHWRVGVTHRSRGDRQVGRTTGEPGGGGGEPGRQHDQLLTTPVACPPSRPSGHDSTRRTPSSRNHHRTSISPSRG
ncbi:hypothetical protein GCM10029963_71010 [Micromonospora andamanensis]